MKGGARFLYIKELIIEEFSAALNQKITLDSTLNLITGENESGKSTICAFIKFIFYGFTDSKERTRFSSLKTGNSSGSMTVVHDGKTYRIARRASGRLQTVIVYDEDDGAEFTDWKEKADTPGEYFLGIPASLYTKSIYVSQADGSHLDGGSAEAISNLLLTGDDALNLKKAKKLLDDARKALKLRRGVGGLIADLEATIEALKAKKASAMQAKQELEAVSLALQNEKQNIESQKARLDQAKRTLELIKAKKLLTYLDKLDELNAAQSKNKILLDELVKTNTFDSFTPDSKYEEELLTLSNQIAVYEAQIKRNEDRLVELRLKLNAVPPKEYDAYCKLGKREALLPIYENNLLKFKLFGIGALISILVFVIFLGITVMKASGALDISGAFTVAVMCIFAATSVALSVLFIFKRNALAALRASISADSARTVLMICRDCEEYEQKLSSGELGYLMQLLEESKESFDALNQKLQLQLARWNKPNAEKAICDYRDYAYRLYELQGEQTKNKTDISVINAYLSGYTENDIELARKLPKDTVFPSESSVSEEYIIRVSAQLTESERRATEYEITLAGTASKTDIEQITTEIEEAEEKLADYNIKYDAITLALQSLESAEISIRKTVSPYLSEHSGRYFEKITGGKYLALRLDPEMNLSYIPSDSESVTDSAYFSAGSADLAWICLRLALHKRLSENTVIPLVLDEALVYFDDTRLKGILGELSQLAENGVQIILLSASSREKTLLPKSVNHITLC